MRVTALRDLDQLIDDVLRRGLIGIAHAEIDDVFAASARSHFELAHLIEHVGWQALNAREFFSQGDYNVTQLRSVSGAGTLPGVSPGVKPQMSS